MFIAIRPENITAPEEPNVVAVQHGAPLERKSYLREYYKHLAALRPRLAREINTHLSRVLSYYHLEASLRQCISQRILYSSLSARNGVSVTTSLSYLEVTYVEAGNH